MSLSYISAQLLPFINNTFICHILRCSAGLCLYFARRFLFIILDPTCRERTRFLMTESIKTQSSTNSNLIRIYSPHLVEYYHLYSIISCEQIVGCFLVLLKLRL